MARGVAGSSSRHGREAPTARRHTPAVVAQRLLICRITMRRLSRLKGVDFGLAFAVGVALAMFTG